MGAHVKLKEEDMNDRFHATPLAQAIIVRKTDTMKPQIE